MELLQKIGLVKILSNGEIYCTQVENMIGEKSIGAFKKQQQRLLTKGGQEGGQKGGQEVENCPIEIELDIEIEKELKNIVKDTKLIFQKLIEIRA